MRFAPQVQGQVSYERFGVSGAVGPVAHATIVLRSETASSNRTIVCRVMQALLESGERHRSFWCGRSPVTAGYTLSRQVT